MVTVSMTFVSSQLSLHSLKQTTTGMSRPQKSAYAMTVSGKDFPKSRYQ